MAMLTTLFHVALMVGFTIVRLMPLLVVVAILFYLWRRSVRKGKEPDVKGNVVDVDYRVVEDEDTKEDQTAD